MSWYLRAVEQVDGQWSCRFGRQDLGVEPDREAVLRKLVQTAGDLGGRDRFVIYLHHADGKFESRHATDPLPDEVGWAPNEPAHEPPL